MWPLLILAAAGAVFLTVTQKQTAMTTPTAPPDGRGTNTPGPQPRPEWQPPERAAPYLAVIRETENGQGLPYNLLARLLWQESRYREDIISGQVVSSAGAVGIAQIVPRWHPDVDPLDPVASIRYAGRYLRALFGQFGSWDQALAAYNWGPGNLSKVRHLDDWLARAPLETRNYVNQITGDVFA